MSDSTKPVYISEQRKRVTKAEAAQEDISMKDVIERLVEHGIPQDLHRVPVDEDPESFDPDDPDDSGSE